MLRHLPTVADPRALVGAATSDDAAVYRLADDLAVVATVDFITPVVDDPYVWGMVAAANALSDIYAMGAQPLFALNTVGFPRETLPLETLGRVLEGGAAKAAEAGIAILGGHSVDDPEPKYGMVVVGVVHPGRVLRNTGARPGDALVLTKPLGVGILTTAIKRGLASAEDTQAVVDVMTALNRAAGEAAAGAGDAVHAATDVTGFGLLGHLAEMVRASGVGAQVEAAAVPVIEAAWEYARRDVVPGGSRRNLAALEGLAAWSETLDDVTRLVLADAQTSGGLLLAVDASRVDGLLEELRGRGVSAAARIGSFAGRVGIVVR